MIENQILGNKLNRAKPVALTFYDSLETYPYSTTFYVHDNTLNEQCEKLIQAISDLSSCVLGKYNIGYEQFVVQNYHEKLAKLTPSTFGTEKWVIKYHIRNWTARSHTIPGRNKETSYGAMRPGMGKFGKMPDPNHAKWQAFLQIFQAICVSKEAEMIQGQIELDYSSANWPPKGAKKRR
jgi:hypothetical protein